MLEQPTTQRRGYDSAPAGPITDQQAFKVKAGLLCRESGAVMLCSRQQVHYRLQQRNLWEAMRHAKVAAPYGGRQAQTRTAEAAVAATGKVCRRQQASSGPAAAHASCAGSCCYSHCR